MLNVYATMYAMLSRPRDTGTNGNKEMYNVVARVEMQWVKNDGFTQKMNAR